MQAGKQFFFLTTGKRLPWPNDKCNFVKVNLFKHSQLTAGHISLEIHHEDECCYISLMTDIHENFSNHSLFQLRKGVASYFVPSLQEECQIHGFINSGPHIWQHVPAAFKNKRGETLTAKEVLEIVKQLPIEIQQSLIELGKPHNTLILYSLDTQKMMRVAKSFRNNQEILWASFTGTGSHQKNTHNCANIGLEILYAGGMADLLIPEREIFGIMGGLLGVAYTFTHCESLVNIIVGFAIGFITGRLVGGAVEGYRDIQNFLNIVTNQRQDQLSTLLALRMASVLLGSFATLLPGGPNFTSILTLPNNVFTLALQAKNIEEATYGPEPARRSIRPART